MHLAWISLYDSHRLALVSAIINNGGFHNIRRGSSNLAPAWRGKGVCAEQAAAAPELSSSYDASHVGAFSPINAIHWLLAVTLHDGLGSL